MQSGKQRAFAPDCIRAAALVLVLSVHFFLHSGFYNQPLQGAGMMLSAAVRMACMTCVPMFIMLSGYLCLSWTWSAGYCRRLLRVLLTYVLAGAACTAFRVLWMKEAFTARAIAESFFAFTAAPYAWYIEMYIGLFLLIPFLNAAWHGVGERGKRALVWVLLAMTVIPATVNSFFKLLPAWWTAIYPLAYYFLGARLRERPLKLRWYWLVLGWLGLAGAAAAVLRAMTGGGNFPWNKVSNWDSVFVVGESVCLFSLLQRCTGARLPAPLRRFISWLAGVSLPMFMISYITDRLLYPRLTGAGLTPGRRLLWMPVMVAASIVLSGAMAQVLHWVVSALMKLVPPAGNTSKRSL